MADKRPQGVGRNQDPPQRSNLGPIPIGLFTLGAVLVGAFLVDVGQFLLFPKIETDIRYLVTILCCAFVAGGLAYLAVHRAETLNRKAVRASQQQARLEADLGHILDSVRLFLWHADVVEVDGFYIWDMHISNEEAAGRILPIQVPQGQTWADAWNRSKLPEDRQRSEKASIRAFKTGLKGFSNEYRCFLASGEIRWIYDDILIEPRGAGKFYVMGASFDITQLRKTEVTLEEERTLLKTVMNSLPDPVFVKDRDSRFLLDNAAHLEHLGVKAQDELNGRSDFDLFPKEIAQPFYEDEQSIVQGKKDVINRVEISQDRAGNPRWFWTTKVPLRDTQGQIIGIVGVNRDITARKQEEEELKAAMHAVEVARAEAEHHARLLEEQRRELEKARDEALASTRAKSDFLANMSHEIRTPMNGILGITELMLGTNLTDEQYNLATTVRTSAEALLTVINDILDFSRIEAGKMHIEVTDFNLRTLAEEVTDLVAGNSFGKGLELTCSYEPGAPERVQGDPARIRQVLTNLMGNAVKFTEKGEVSLEVRVLERSETAVNMRLAVVDTGIGVALEAQDKIFESFTQADGTTTRKYGGTGLGLAICKQLAKLMDGEIGMESKEGKGSTFYLDVPLPLQTGEEPKPKRASPESIRGIPVLVVDDNATNRRILREQLLSFGCQPTEVESGAEGLRILASASDAGKPFRVAILDMQMPEMDGEQLGHLIREDPRYDDMPMILYTSMGDHGGPDVMRDKGFSVVLMKPTRQSQILTAILTVLGEQQAEVHAEPTVEVQELAGLKVLLAEDNEINQMVAMMMLERFGCKTSAVGTGKLAVEALAAAHYDVVLMDVHMPEMDGYMATSEIRKFQGPLGKHTPVIAMTAKAMTGDRELCLAAGMDDYIVKPVRPDDLHDVLLRWSRGFTEETKPLTAASGTRDGEVEA